MGGEALDREGAGDALRVVRVGPVVEVFDVRLGRDGGVDLRLAGDAGLPVRVELLRLRRPLVARVAGDLPLLPRLGEGLVQGGSTGLELGLALLPDGRDLSVACYRRGPVGARRVEDGGVEGPGVGQC